MGVVLWLELLTGESELLGFGRRWWWLWFGWLVVTAGAVELEIPNQLGHGWPGELVSFDVAGPVGDEVVVAVQGRRRPGQVERLADGKARVWSYVTIDTRNAAGEKLAVTTVPAVVEAGRVAAGITVAEEGEYYLIDNGTYQFRLRRYQAPFEPQALSELPHWCGGMRTKQQAEWDGEAWFESGAVVKGARTEIVRRGPVFVDFRIIYEFEQPAGDPGETEALPLALGKQSHLFPPNKTPRETVAKLTNAYELMLRFVMDDPWIDINERFHFPRDEAANAYGVTQYYLRWGKRGLPVDTVTWVRWFEYDKFGGNVTQHYVPARRRPAQKGRPFALLRPRWNQGGGGAQDFVLTSGGKPPAYDRKTKQHQAPEDPRYSPDNPAVGVIAAYASKWVGPYVNYIPVYAEDGDTGRARFPMVDGERSGMHYGQRAYGLCVGHRHRLHDLNSVVRRHTDWTLTAQINAYVLDWPRRPELAGPNILLTRKRLKQLQRDWQAGTPSPVNDAIKEQLAKAKPLLDRRDAIMAEHDGEMRAANEALARHRRTHEGDKSKAVRDEQKKLERTIRDLENRRKRDKELSGIRKQLSNRDFQLVELITADKPGDVKMPSSQLWRQRRYQDDFLNPTSSPTRKIVDFAMADLFANGESLGGADQAAMGYIATDLDAWPGWLQGWRPGNPNFHTDKYMAALYLAGALRDHPHAGRWLEYGLENFLDDADKVLLAPDGVGVECPGYAGYAMKLQMDVARILLHLGHGNLMADNPLVKKHAVWHRKLITPYDPRIGRRHEAPIGDTHRWDSGMYADGFAKLAYFYREADPEFAQELMGTYRLLAGSFSAGTKAKKTPFADLVLKIDESIPATPAAELDWSSQAFSGFGAVMRSGFGTAQETFVSYKAGRARGHYHNDENSYHFYADGTPISVDYNCSYTPRGDHAALHNSMTFGLARTLAHNGRKEAVPAQEEIGSSARVVKFAGSDAADLVVSERQARELTLRPLYPRDNEFGRHYPQRPCEPITHRRSLALIKHPPTSPLTDYLVVRDVTGGGEAQQLNVHLLTRELRQDGRTWRGTGQYDKDVLVFLAEATAPKVEVKSWYYRDDWMPGPEPYVLRAGESMAAWNARLQKLMADNGADRLPLPGWSPKWQNPKEPSSQAWFERLQETDGRAMMAPPFWSETWMYGEYQQWLRIETAPGTPITWVLYAHERGAEAPTITTTDNGVRVQLDEHVDEISFTADNGLIVKQNGQATEL